MIRAFGGLVTPGNLSKAFKDSFRSSGPFQGVPGIPPLEGFTLLNLTPAWTANVKYWCMFVPDKTITVTKGAIQVFVVASGNDNIDIGIADENGNILGSSGLTNASVNVLGLKTISLQAGVQLQAGKKYYSIYSQPAGGFTGGTAPSLPFCGIISGNSYPDMFGNTLGTRLLGFTAGGGAIGNTQLVNSGATGFAPAIYWLET